MVDPRLRNQDTTIRLMALAELFTSREPDPERLEDSGAFLDDPNQNARRLAVEVFVMYGSLGVSYLAHALAESQPLDIRQASAVGLGRLGPLAAPAIAVLCRCLESEDEKLRDHASWALSRIAPESVPSLRSMLYSSNPDAVLAAASALESMADGAAESLEDLRALALSAQSPTLRIACLSAIAGITAEPFAVVPDILLAAQGAPDEKVRAMCVEKVTNLGERAKGFGPDIIRFAHDESPVVRSATAMGLAKIQMDPVESVPVLITLLDDPAPKVLEQTIMALACFGPAAGEAVPALARVNQQGREKLSGMAGVAIEKIAGTP
jgi:HEAT repeat protein